MISGLLLVVALWLLLSSIPSLKEQNYIDAFLMSLWSGISFDLSLDLAFNRKISKMLELRKKDDLEDVFWKIDTSLKPAQTELKIPKYYFESDARRVDVQPFDPRFTLGFYYWYLRKHAKDSSSGVQAPFHWADWMDMSALDKFIFGREEKLCQFFDLREAEAFEAAKHDKENKHEALDPIKYCVNDTDLPELFNDGNRLRMGFNIKAWPGRMYPKMAVIAGKSYMYTHAPPPSSVIFMTDDGSYNMTVSTKEKLLHNGIVEEYLKLLGKTTINTVKEFALLNKQVPSYKERVMHNYQVDLRHLDFVLKPQKIIQEFKELANTRPLSQSEKDYVNSVKTSFANQNSPPKFFAEARIINSAIGDHYDWRFFNGIRLHTEEQSLTLHRMVRTWLSFCRKQGITTWMAHGSLLSWYWNGIGFPWDNDIDVQVPLRDLHKLGLYFNQSLVVEDGQDGFGRYFVDVTSSITVRDHSNGKNNIDARFIDVDSGLYIDITGLAVSGDAAPSRYTEGLLEEFKSTSDKLTVNDHLQVYNCRNKHFLSLNEISPLIKTFVEGKAAYVPKRYSDIITAEYNQKGLLDKFFSGRLFMPQLRLWLGQDDLKIFVRARESWIRYFSAKSSAQLVGLKKPNSLGGLTSTEVTKLIEMGENDLLDLMLNDEILMKYASLRDMTSLHEKEIMRLLFGKSTEQLVKNVKDFPPLTYDPFLFRIREEYTSYDGEVQRYIGLNEKKKAWVEQTQATASSEISEALELPELVKIEEKTNEASSEKVEQKTDEASSENVEQKSSENSTEKAEEKATEGSNEKSEDKSNESSDEKTDEKSTETSDLKAEEKTNEASNEKVEEKN